MFMVLVDTAKAPVKQTAELSSSMTHYFAVFFYFMFCSSFLFFSFFYTSFANSFQFLRNKQNKKPNIFFYKIFIKKSTII